MIKNPETFAKRLDEYANNINAALEGYLDAPKDGQENVREAMRYSVSAGGKRIRPVLTLEFCKMLGDGRYDAMPFACAVEMVHSYSLIHDDLPCMDDDDFRRGKPSCHVKFGEACALLAGDALLTLAFNVIASAKDIPPHLQVKAVKVLSECAGINGMVGGQSIDLQYEGKVAEEGVIKTMHSLKTGALLSAACSLGAIAADAEVEDILAAQKFGHIIGLAFQIVDDILDVTGDEKSLGKPVGSDKQHDKSTFVSVYGLEGAKEKAAAYTDSAKEIIRRYSGSGFLLELTDYLLNRNF